MAYMNMDLADMPYFFKGLGEVCQSFCEEQGAIDRAFNEVQRTWRDNNAVFTGREIRTTAEEILRFYSYLDEAIAHIAKVCDNRAIYNGSTRITPPEIERFTVNLTEETNVNDTQIQTTPEALEDFKNALEKYIQSIIDNVNLLIGHYNRIGESWDDAQYENFGDALNEFCKSMQAQIDKLMTIVEFLRDKIDFIRNNEV